MRDLKQRTALKINSVLQKFGAEIVRREAHDAPSHGQTEIPGWAKDYLQPGNPRLLELRRRYAGHPAAEHTQWSEDYLREDLSLQFFRGDNLYLYQKRFSNEAAYLLSTYYAQTIDGLGLLGKLRDDELFGNHLINFNDSLAVSRDLLDSVIEINFLHRTLGLCDWPNSTVLDIGAGYGRLAHRLVEASPNIERVLCADAVAESTFLCEFYLKFRGIEERARAVPLDNLEEALRETKVSLAVNIHSFGECGLAVINWWLDLVARHGIRYLFIVPNSERLHSREHDRTTRDYLPSILDRGYRLMHKEPKYSGASSVQQHGAYPTVYYLFEAER